MVDIKRLLDPLFGARRLGRNALTYGGLLLLAGLAYRAWRDWPKNRRPLWSVGASDGHPDDQSRVFRHPLEQAPRRADSNPSDSDAAATLRRGRIRAMIAAAKADSHIDAEEQRRIVAHAEIFGLDAEEKAFVIDELAKPLDIDEVVAGAPSPEAAADIYAASLIAIDPNDPAAKAYLAALADRLRLGPEEVERLHANAQTV